MSDLARFVAYSKTQGLLGVIRPYWQTWGEANPPDFLTPDPLHAWHIFFFDHVVKWIENIMGPEELDYRLKVLQPRVGTRSWPNGVTKLKQLTGREHRELEKVIIAVAGDALPPGVMCAVRALLDFIFQAQGLVFYEENIHALEVALAEFHHFKNEIIKARGRRGKHDIIPHFRIPKLELMQGVTDSVRLLGAPYQYTSDVTERLHHFYAKQPYRFSNGHNYHPQCVRYLDREEKVRHFDFYTRLKVNGISLLNEMVDEAKEVATDYPESEWISRVLPDERHVTVKGTVDFFAKVRSRILRDNTIAILLNARAHALMTIDEASTSFGLPDLRPALGDYVAGRSYDDRGGVRRSRDGCELPFTHINVWHNMRFQRRSAQDSRVLLPPQTIQALPRSNTMLHGRGNPVVIQDPNSTGAQTSESPNIRM